MKKVIIAVLLAAFIGTGAFAQIIIGSSGALYYFEDKDFSTVITDFKNGEGVFYGGFAEVVFDNIGLGLSGNVSNYYDEFVDHTFQYGDFTLYGSYHLFGGKAFLDPFGEVGFGLSSYDYANSIDDTDEFNPMAASTYWFGGFGLGVNLGSFGTFMKVSYNQDTELPVYKKDANGDEYVDPITGEKEKLPPFTMFPVKFTVGVKLIL